MAKPDDARVQTYARVSTRRRDTGPESAGQSGDTQGLSDTPCAGNDSVMELLEEGQSFEAAVVEGVENAPAADEQEIHTKEAPEDDVPPEYWKPDIPRSDQ